MVEAVQPLVVVGPFSELLVLLPGKSVEQPDAARRNERQIDKRGKQTS